MARRSKPERVLGPYRHYRKWRVLLVSAGGAKTVTDYEDEAKARQVVRSLRRELAKGGDRTVLEAREKYEMYMRDDKGNKLRSIAATAWRLGIFFHEDDLLLDQLTSHALQGLLRRLADASAAEDEAAAGCGLASEHLGGGEVVPWWCVGKKWLARNPLDEVEGVGKRRHGKEQLRIDEARRWQAKAIEFADQGEAGAVAAMMCAGDGDAGVGDGQPGRSRPGRRGEAAVDPGLEDRGGRRKLQVPEFLQPYLRRMAEGTGSDGGAVRGALAGLAAEVGAADLQGGGGAEGDGARDAGAARHARGGQRDHLSRGRVGARSRVVQDDGRELRAARRGGGRPAEEGARRAGGREARLLNRPPRWGQAFPNRSLEGLFNRS